MPPAFTGATRRRRETLVPRPDSYYGVSKVFGEAMGRMYADKFGLQVLSMRIGAYRDRPSDPRQLAVWVSPRDMVELVRCGIDAPDFDYATVYGVSANTRSFWDNSDAAFLGYAPRDNAEDWAEEVLAGPPEDLRRGAVPGRVVLRQGFRGALTLQGLPCGGGDRVAIGGGIGRRMPNHSPSIGSADTSPTGGGPWKASRPYSRVNPVGTSGFCPALPHSTISLPHGSRKAWL